jgi:hypothetical protein
MYAVFIALTNSQLIVKLATNTFASEETKAPKSYSKVFCVFLRICVVDCESCYEYFASQETKALKSNSKVFSGTMSIRRNCGGTFFLGSFFGNIFTAVLFLGDLFDVENARFCSYVQRRYHVTQKIGFSPTYA